MSHFGSFWTPSGGSNFGVGRLRAHFGIFCIFGIFVSFLSKSQRMLVQQNDPLVGWSLFENARFCHFWGSEPYPTLTQISGFWPFFRLFKIVILNPPSPDFSNRLLSHFDHLEKQWFFRFSGFGPLFSEVATLRRWIWVPCRMTGRPWKMTFLAIFGIFAKMPFWVKFLKISWFWTSFCHGGPPQTCQNRGFFAFLVIWGRFWPDPNVF